MKKTFAALLSALVIGQGSAAFAVTVASESFLSGNDPAAGEYVNDKPFDGFPAGNDPQNPTVDGFTGAWNNGGTALWQSTDAGLTHSALGGEEGGSARFRWPDEVGLRNVKRNLTSPPPITSGATYWMTALVQADELDSNGFAYAGFASDLNDDNQTQGLRVGVQGNGDGMDLVFRHRSGAVVTESVILQSIAAGETHLVVIQANVNSDLGGGGVPGNDNINIWVNPVNLDALGTADVMLEDFALFNNTGLQFLTLEGSNITGEGVRFDEIRLGTTLADVASLPEPMTASLAALAGLALIGRRRR